jgi:hypothetical protein
VSEFEQILQNAGDFEINGIACPYLFLSKGYE